MFKCTSFDLEKDIFRVYDSDDEVTEECSEQEVREYLAGGAVIEDLPDLFTPKISKNRNLSKAKKEKNDEFYTQLSDIEKELSHYPLEAFKDKVIYLPMDIAITDGNIKQSKFVTYFQMNAHKLQFKRLIATCLVEKTDGVGRNYYILNRQTVSYCTPENQASGKSPIAEVMRDDGRIYYKYKLTSSTPTHDYQLDEDGFRYVPVPDTTINQAILDEGGAYTYKGASGAWDNQMYRFVDNLDAEEICPADEVYGSGDFRSEYCTRLLQEADIVVTNPPFSLFRQFTNLLIEKDCKYIILGDKNAINYLLPLIKDNKMWLGASVHSGERYFIQPETDELSKGIGVRWFTNVRNDVMPDKLYLMTKSENELSGFIYQQYDNFNAIECGKTNKIPSDYKGVIGVPITFIDKYCAEQFEILGCAIAGYTFCSEKGIISNTNKKEAAYLNGKKLYSRILIRRR